MLNENMQRFLFQDKDSKKNIFGMISIVMVFY